MIKGKKYVNFTKIYIADCELRAKVFCLERTKSSKTKTVDPLPSFAVEAKAETCKMATRNDIIVHTRK